MKLTSNEVRSASATIDASNGLSLLDNAGLTVFQRAVAFMHWRQGKSLSAIAREFGLNPVKVNREFSQAMRKIARIAVRRSSRLVS